MNSIILTGVTRGLGKEIHDILLTEKYLNTDRIFVSRQVIKKPFRPGISYIQIDLADTEIDVKKIAINRDSTLVIFISNAGTINPIGSVLKTNISNIEPTLRVNFLSPLYIAQHLAVETKKISARLFIIDISSGAATRAIGGWLAYCVSKASVKMAFDVLSAENEHIEVCHLDPGVMDTDMQALIRTQGTENMPDVDVFKSYKNSEKLQSPREVALQVIHLMEEITK